MPSSVSTKSQKSYARNQIVTNHSEGKTFQVIANETNIPRITVTKIYRTATDKSMDLQTPVDSPKTYINTRGRGRRVHLSQEDADANYITIVKI